VDEGRRHLSELQTSDWVDDEVDYDELMAGLATGRSAVSLIARDRHRPSFGVRTSARDHELIAELTALARAPYLAASWPAPPEVALDALESDFARTTGRTLQLALRWENYPDGGVWVCAVSVDGKARGSTGVREGTPGEVLADIADRLCEGWLHEEIWGGWPLCKKHRHRPMWAEPDEAGIAQWVCEADPADRVPIGHLRN
jgi:hypothetical protein